MLGHGNMAPGQLCLVDIRSESARPYVCSVCRTGAQSLPHLVFTPPRTFLLGPKTLPSRPRNMFLPIPEHFFLIPKHCLHDRRTFLPLDQNIAFSVPEHGLVDPRAFLLDQDIAFLAPRTWPCLARVDDHVLC